MGRFAAVFTIAASVRFGSRLCLCHSLCIQRIEVDGLQYEFGETTFGNDGCNRFAGIGKQNIRAKASNQRLEFIVVVAVDVKKAGLVKLYEEKCLIIFFGLNRNMAARLPGLR